MSRIGGGIAAGLVVAAVALTAFALPASASLVGDEIDISLTFQHPAGVPTGSGYTATDAALTGVTVADTNGPPEA